MPVSNADFREYANLAAAEFERYSSALTRHFQCLDAAWQDGIDHGRKVAAEREVFVARAKALDIKDRIGVAPQERLERRAFSLVTISPAEPPRDAGAMLCQVEPSAVTSLPTRLDAFRIFYHT